MLSTKLIVFLLLAVSLQSAVADLFQGLFYVQRYGVQGQFTCRGKPYTDGGIVEVWDYDRGEWDDLMGTVPIQPDGKFYVLGSESEFGSVDPYVMYHHRCGHEDMEPDCYWVERLPQINKSKIWSHWSDTGGSETSVENLGQVDLYNYSDKNPVESSVKQCQLST